ncbi:hypothetical protein [Nonomuraea roseola]|uniref:Uncharacterized protein n=1 Tax=Nonomuraea roseola TaxID=46179 RepID=A0ABV5QEQ5_9ACTN
MDDSFSVGVSFRGTVSGQNGNDSLIAGAGSSTGRAITWSGGAGIDTVSYKSSSLSVRVSLDNQANLAADGDLNCGLGVDEIVLDKAVDPRPVGCETVQEF